jgi:hypothetical protein
MQWLLKGQFKDSCRWLAREAFWCILVHLHRLSFKVLHCLENLMIHIFFVCMLNNVAYSVGSAPNSTLTSSVKVVTNTVSITSHNFFVHELYTHSDSGSAAR